MNKPVLTIALLAAAAMTVASRPAVAQTVKPVCTEGSRACLLKTTRVYIDGLSRHDPAHIPFAPNVRCTEQALIPVTNEKTFRSEIASSTAITKIRNIRLLADPVTQSVAAFFLIDVAGDPAKHQSPYTVRRGERFKIVRGLITEVEAYNYVDPELHGLAQPLWPD